MPKYYEFKVAGYYLYFTSFCIVECMHVHASDRKLTESGSAKFFVKGNGDTVIQNRGVLTDRELNKIQEFIKENYEKMIRIAEQLSENLVHMRVDLYNIDGQIYFGELTFFDQGGFDTDITLETDLKWGELMDLDKIK